MPCLSSDYVQYFKKLFLTWLYSDINVIYFFLNKSLLAYFSSKIDLTLITSDRACG